MYKSAQVVFVYDVNCLNSFYDNESEFTSYCSKLKLGCLRLLTELSSQCKPGVDLNWAFKFYDSCIFKRGKLNRRFQELTASAFNSFDKELTSLFTAKREAYLAEAKNDKTPNHPHSYMLNKALQEALKDYNWEITDNDSPINKRKSRKSNESQKDKSYNAIIVFNSLPNTNEEMRKFIGSESNNLSIDNFLKNLLEPATINELKENQFFQLDFVDININNWIQDKNSINSAIANYMNKLNSCLHSLFSLVDHSDSSSVKKEGNNNYLIGPCMKGLDNQWFIKGNKQSSARCRKAQPGPSLIWQDDEGISFIKITLEILRLNGR